VAPVAGIESASIRFPDHRWTVTPIRSPGCSSHRSESRPSDFDLKASSPWWSALRPFPLLLERATNEVPEW